MCLLIAGKSNEIRAALLNTEGLLLDIFKHNADGLGAMYTTSKRKLRTPKVLPKTLGECIAFIRQLPDDDRSLALHWRMRTHGATDLENCHPYPVIDGKIAMMHNGILSQGNAADKTKSDTWHYIADVVRPMLAEYPKLFTNKAWISLVEDDISSGNRFAIMDNEGDLVIMNKHTGINHGDLWFSNTYAWDPSLLIPGYAKARKTSYLFDDDKDDIYDTWYGRGAYATGPVRKSIPTSTKAEAMDEIVAGPLDMTEDDVWEALRMCDHQGMRDLLLESPLLVLHMLLRDCEFVPVSGAEVPDYSERDEDIVRALVDQTYMPLVEIIRTSDAAAMHVAQVICWYGDWVGKAIDAKPEARDNIHDEIVDVLAKECPDMVKGLDAPKRLTLAKSPVMEATRDAVQAHQADADRESEVAALEAEIEDLEETIAMLGPDDQEEIYALEAEILELQEQIDQVESDIHAMS